MRVSNLLEIGIKDLGTEMSSGIKSIGRQSSRQTLTKREPVKASFGGERAGLKSPPPISV